MADVKFTFKKNYYDTNGRSGKASRGDDLNWTGLSKLSSGRVPQNYCRFTFKTNRSEECRAFSHGASTNVPTYVHGSSKKESVSTKSKARKNPKVDSEREEEQTQEPRVVPEPEKVEKTHGSDNYENKSDVAESDPELEIICTVEVSQGTSGDYRNDDMRSASHKQNESSDLHPMQKNCSENQESASNDPMTKTYVKDPNEKEFIALCDYTAKDASEVSFLKNDILRTSLSSTPDPEFYLMGTVIRTGAFGLAPRKMYLTRSETYQNSTEKQRESFSIMEAANMEKTPRKRPERGDDDLPPNRNCKSRKVDPEDIPSTSDMTQRKYIESVEARLEARMDCMEQDSNLQFKEIYRVQKKQQKDIEQIRKEQEEQRKMLQQWVQHIPQQIKKIDGLMDRSPDYQLKDNCLEADLRYNGDTPSDGNGFFHAISDQLDLLGKPRQTVSELRANVVKFLKENPKIEGPSGTINFKASQTDWEDYLKTMSEDGVWADNVIVQSMACYLKTDIFIVTSCVHGDAEPMYQRAPGGQGIPIRVSHVNGCHFRSLVALNSSENSPSPKTRSSKDSCAVELVLPTITKERVSVSSKLQQLLSKQNECTTILKASDSSELTEILQYLLQISEDDIDDIDRLSKEEKARRIYGHLAGPINGVEVDLKSYNCADISRGLMRIVHAWKDHVGFNKTEADTLAKAVIESDDISCSQELSKLHRGQSFVSKAFKEYQFSIGWQTKDGFPLFRSTDLGSENNVHIMKRIYYTVIRNPSESYWANQMKKYKDQLLERMNAKYKEGDPRLPDWFEDTHKFDLMRQCSEAMGEMLQKGKQASRCSNIVYLWSVYFGDKFAPRHKFRSYAGVATGANLLRDRWGQHFRAALQLIKLLLKCDIVPRKTPDWILYVDLLLALAIVGGFDMYPSALYCLGVFADPKTAQDHEKKIIEQLKLTQLDRGLNRKL